jgi:hypothetical protein
MDEINNSNQSTVTEMKEPTVPLNNTQKLDIIHQQHALKLQQLTAQAQQLDAQQTEIKKKIMHIQGMIQAFSMLKQQIT